MGTLCPLTSCTVSDAGDCDSGTITNAPPFSVTGTELNAKQNVVEGYTYNVCLKCQTAAELDLTIDNFEIKQKPKSRFI